MILASTCLGATTSGTSGNSGWTCQDVAVGGSGSCSWYTYIRFENLILDAQLRGGCSRGRVCH
jgi:hypothetical protein